jgi:hypothetical protein
VDSSLTSRTQRVLFSCACLHTNSMPTWQSFPFQRMFSCYVFFPCAPMHSLNAHLAELSESSMILSLLNSQQSSSSVHSLHLLNAHLEELYRIHNRILSATVSLPHSLASKVFSNLKGLPPELLTSVPVPQHVFV